MFGSFCQQRCNGDEGLAGYPRIILIIPGQRAHHCTALRIVLWCLLCAACNALAFVRSTPARHVLANTMTWVYLCIYLRFLLFFPYKCYIVVVAAVHCCINIYIYIKIPKVHQNPLQCLACSSFLFVERALKK